MRIHRFTLAVSTAAVVLLLCAGPGVRRGFWTFGTGFTVLRWAAYLGLAAAAAALVQLLIARWRGPHSWQLALAVGLGLLTAGLPWYWRQRALQAPPIHDITTDTQDPPRFLAVLPLRAEAPNPAAYGGPKVAAAQTQAYPDLRPLLLPATRPALAFRHALDAARAAGWTIVAAESGAGRIEATATTGWFGFKDDVVIRIRAVGTGSRVDVRSVSRVGESDVGTNARRIQTYLRRLAKMSERAGDVRRT